MGQRTQPSDFTKLRRGLSGMFYVSPSGPSAPGAMPRAEVVRAPAITGGAGRRMTYEEGAAQEMLQMNQTIAGTNHLTNSCELPLGIAEAVGGIAPDERRSRLPYVFMGIQGQAPAQIVLPAIGSTQVVVSFTCPRRQNGEIEFIGNQFVGGGWTEGSGAMIWQLLIDGVPVQGFDAILGSMGTMANPGWLGKGAIQFSEGQAIQLQLRNVSVVVNQQVLLGMLRGTFFPLEQKGERAWS